MNIIEILTNDHREVEGMIARLERGGPQPQVFAMLKSSIRLHSEIEEQLFYPALEESPSTEAIVDDSYAEHRGVDRILDAMSVENRAEFQAKLAELKARLGHHVREEELDLFPKAEGVLGKPRLEEIGRRAMIMKQRNRAA